MVLAASVAGVLASAGAVALARGSTAAPVSSPAHRIDAAAPRLVVTAATPLPAPVATATPAPAPARAPVVVAIPGPVAHVVRPSVVVRPPAPPKPAPAPATHVNYLASDDGTLNTSVGTYADCTGNNPLGDAAALLTCVTGRLYFAGHNYGVFTPLMHMDSGSGITYWDARGASHHFRVVSVRPSWSASSGVPPVTEPDVVAQFQTCAVPDGSIDRILDATLDGGAPLANLISPVVAPVATAVNSTGATATTTTTSTAGNLIWNLFGHH